MKTLDEVIKAFECCNHGELDSRCEECQYNGIGTCCLERESDALCYLKEYKERKELLRYWSEKAISEQQNLSDAITFMRAYRDDKDDLTALRAYWKEQHENNALTWEQLKQMEGKPVWVEYKWYDGKGEWTIIRIIDEDNMIDDDGVYPREQFGVDWQAYRKEMK